MKRLQSGENGVNEAVLFYGIGFEDVLDESKSNYLPPAPNNERTPT